MTAVTEAGGSHTYDIAVIGAGYVGVPLAATFAEAGLRVLLVDIQPAVVARLNDGESHIEDVPSKRLAPLVAEEYIVATTDYAQVEHAAAVLIALPTPLSRQREPDLSAIEKAARSLGPVLQARGVTITPELLAALPYVMTIVVLVVVSAGSTRRRLGAPAALGRAYVREER